MKATKTPWWLFVLLLFSSMLLMGWSSDIDNHGHVHSIEHEHQHSHRHTGHGERHEHTHSHVCMDHEEDNAKDDKSS